ncbi:TPA: hypothetical protein DDZ86_01820 [Candidatus Dependentiae bacterium]|nr:MAG: hypothetical protein UW09_C0001G0273 [candidate division TM6 bacterium GW2011_GWF2_43_87]HBL98362.1 hypothetical protein [Candidatus Dependentiae bacterium]
MRILKSIFFPIALFSIICTYNAQAGKLHRLVATKNIEGITKLLEPSVFAQISSFLSSSVPINIDGRNRLGRTALHVACEYNSMKLTQVLVSSCAKFDLENNLFETVPFLGFIDSNASSIAYLLITNGASLNVQDNIGFTPLHLACKNNFAMVDLLVRMGANLNIQDNTGLTPLNLACKDGNMPAIRLLTKGGASLDIQDNSGLAPLHWSSKLGNALVVQHLIVSHANLNIQDNVGFTPLHEACRNNNGPVVQILVASRANLNIQDNVGRIALHLACENDKIQFAQLLIDWGANPNTQDNNGLTPLHVACGKNWLQLVQLLVNKGANLNLKDNDGLTPLQEVCKNNKIQMAQLLINLGADLNVEDNDGFTLLHLACKEGNLDRVKLLIDGGADLNVQSNAGFTALHWACMTDNAKLVKLLVGYGANLNLKDNLGCTPLHLVCMHEKKKIAPLLIMSGATLNLKDNDGLTPLQEACKNNKMQMAQLLINLGADLNVEDNDGFTLLHLACKEGNLDRVKFFIDGGADLNRKDKYGNAPLYYAFVNNNIEILELFIAHKANLDDPSILLLACFLNNPIVAKLLIEGGAKLDVKGYVGLTPLHYTCIHNNIDVAKLLIEKGADLNPTNTVGYTPLHYASENNCVEIAKLLVEKGACLGLTNKVDYTPLHYACEKNNSEIVKLLVIHQADLNLKTKDGLTPLHLACKKDNLQNIKFLIRWGASADLKSGDGYTPLELVCENKNLEITKFLIENGAEIWSSFIHIYWDIEQITKLFEALVPFKTRNKDSAQDKFLRSVLEVMATEFKNSCGNCPMVPEGNPLFNSKDVEDPAAIIKAIEYFIWAFFSRKAPDWIMPWNWHSVEEDRVCRSVCTTTPFPLLVKRFFNLTSSQFDTLCKRLKFAQAGYGQYFDIKKMGSIINSQHQLAPYRHFQDINIWFEKDKKLFDSFVRSCKIKPSVALLDLFLKNYQESAIKDDLFEELLSTVQGYLKMEDALIPEFQDFINTLPEPSINKLGFEAGDQENKSNLKLDESRVKRMESNSSELPELGVNKTNVDVPAEEPQEVNFLVKQPKDGDLLTLQEPLTSEVQVKSAEEDAGKLLDFLIQQQEEGESPTVISNEPESISLHSVCQGGGTVKTIKELIGKGAKVDLKDSLGYTPLHYAAFSHRCEFERVLVEMGADVNLKDPNGRTALDLDPEISKFFMQKKDPFSAFEQPQKRYYVDDVIMCKSCIKDSLMKIGAMHKELKYISAQSSGLLAGELSRRFCQMKNDVHAVWGKIAIASSVICKRQKKVYDKMDFLLQKLSNGMNSCKGETSLEDKLKLLQKRSSMLNNFAQSQLLSLKQACFIIKNDIYDRRLVWNK